MVSEEDDSSRERVHNAVTAQKLLQEGYSPKEILALSKVSELGLDERLLKESLASQDAGRKVLSTIIGSTAELVVGLASIPVLVAASMYLPFTAYRFANRHEILSDIELKDVPVELRPKSLVANSFIYGHLFTAAGYSVYAMFNDGYPKQLIPHIGAAVTVIAANGVYEWYRSLKQHAIQENLSKLEQLVEENGA